MNLPLLAFPIAVAFALYSNSSAATVSAPSTSWTPLSIKIDTLADAASAPIEVVGDANNYALFVTFNDVIGSGSNTDGTFGFRIRLDGADKGNAGFKNTAWLGIDANGDNVIDAFISVNKTTVGIFSAVTTGAGTGPGTTTIGTSQYSYAVDINNYDYRAVTTNDGGTSLDLNPGGNKAEIDYYVSALVNYQDLSAYLSTVTGTTINDKSALKFDAGTSTDGTNLNGDIAGINGGLSNTTWGTAITNPQAVPEPSSFILSAMGCCVALLRRKRSK